MIWLSHRPGKPLDSLGQKNKHKNDNHNNDETIFQTTKRSLRVRNKYNTRTSSIKIFNKLELPDRRTNLIF